MSLFEYDVLIIGAGPVGLYTGFYCGLRKLKTLVVDSLEFSGGQMFNQYPEKIVYDLPGYLKITASGFIEKLDNQIKTVDEYVRQELNFKIESIEKHGEGFVATGSKGSITTKTIILAMGNGSFVPRKMELLDEDKYSNINYFVRKTSEYVDKDVLILGGGDSAIDWALMLEPLARSVTLVHRRNEFRAKEGNVDKLFNSKVRVLKSYVPVELQGNGLVLESLVIENVVSKEKKVIKCDDLIVSYGTMSSVNYLDDWGLSVDNKKVIIDLQSKTNIPGIFAAGDVTTYEGREIQIISGLAEGMKASASANQYINKGIKQRPVR